MMKDIGLEKLEPGKRYTLFSISDFGFPYAMHITLEEAGIRPYAQYQESAYLSFKQKKHRRLSSVIFTPIKRFAIWEGWIDVNADMWGESEKSGNGVTVTQSKYSSFDGRYFQDGLDSAPKPLVVYKGRYLGCGVISEE